MLIILSPAKTMDMTRGREIVLTEPMFEKEAEHLAGIMRMYSAEGLEKLLKVSGKLAKENYLRYQQFNAPDNLVAPAVFAYNGSVFKNISPADFSKEDLSYTQDHLRIISTLYGLVKPLDGIKAYRMSYLLKLKGVDGKNLYDYWKPQLTSPLISDVKKMGGTLVNLASLDVLEALEMVRLENEVEIITPEFQEERKGKFETVRTYTKQARGAMTRYILLNRIESPDRLKEFEWEGFRFNEKISDRKKYIFTRKNG